MKVNRNILWAGAFVNELAAGGVKYACISPGSRNTSLTLAFAQNKKIKTFVHIDERSSAFFALGLAKASGTPAAVVTTSGTAAAELYPAIIEAYKQRVPLIICTADRPPELINAGANQTINQENLYKNHIRVYINPGLPEPSLKGLKKIKAAAEKALILSCKKSPGPVHINFPFRKPFEPEDFTDNVNSRVVEYSLTPRVDSNLLSRSEPIILEDEKWFHELFKYFRKFEKGLIVAGPENYNPAFHENCLKLSKLLGYPVLADGASQLRFGHKNSDNLIVNFDALLRSKKFSKSHSAEVIIQFGRTVTSKALEEYFENSKSRRYLINEFGDWFDPSNKAKDVFACKPYLFCERMIRAAEQTKFKRSSSGWLREFKEADIKAAEVRINTIESTRFPDEARIIHELINNLPDEVNLMLSNSLPVRDFDYFAADTGKKISIFNNRGASGIDGITSTALGILEASGKPTVLLTGDMAFYYDLNGLLAAKKYSLPLVIVLINNNGGGIFGVLPISKYGAVFDENFTVPHNLDFSHFVKAYGGTYKQIKSWKDFASSITQAFGGKKFTVLEVKTNAVKSLAVRRNYWQKTAEALD